MTQAKTIIAFDEGRLPPAGTYAFELDLTGENGCAMVETLVWLIDSLKSPFEVWAGQEQVSPDELADSYTKLTVWTSDRDNADFLLLMHELGVDVVRAQPKD